MVTRRQRRRRRWRRRRRRRRQRRPWKIDDRRSTSDKRRRRSKMKLDELAHPEPACVRYKTRKSKSMPDVHLPTPLRPQQMQIHTDTQCSPKLTRCSPDEKKHTMPHAPAHLAGGTAAVAPPCRTSISKALRLRAQRSAWQSPGWTTEGPQENPSSNFPPSAAWHT